jgi:hypothetical protein
MTCIRIASMGIHDNFTLEIIYQKNFPEDLKGFSPKKQFDTIKIVQKIFHLNEGWLTTI